LLKKIASLFSCSQQLTTTGTVKTRRLVAKHVRGLEVPGAREWVDCYRARFQVAACTVILASAKKKLLAECLHTFSDLLVPKLKSSGMATAAANGELVEEIRDPAAASPHHCSTTLTTCQD